MAKMQQDGWTRREFMIAGSTVALGAALPLGCGGDAKEQKAGSADDPAAKGTPWAGTLRALDLSDALHLADVDHFGEFMDFGTAARFKYTLGGWMSGWNNDSSMNGVAYTWATKRPSRLYFNLEKATDLELEFRVKKGGVDYFSVYINDHALERITLDGGDFVTKRIKTTAENTVPGENYLKLIYNDSEKIVAGEPAAFAVDYIRVIPAGTPSPSRFDPPHLARMVQQYKTGGKEYRSLMMQCPTTISYYVEVPADGAFCTFAAPVVDTKGKTKPVALKVSVTPATGGAPKDVFSKEIGDDKWTDVMADLSAFGGQLVKLDVSVTGPANTRFALGVPSIRTRPAASVPTKKVKNVVVLLIDTLRADKLRDYGNKRVKTSQTEAFVKGATLFEACQANSNWTKPSCGSVLTGLHPDSHMARGHASRLNKSVKMVSEMFREKGFNTGAFVANGYLAKEFGFDRGWTKYVNYIRETKNSDAENVFRDSLNFINESGDKPFFTYIQTIDPHVPYDPPAEDLKLYDARSYEGPVQPRSTGNLLEDFKKGRVPFNTRDKRRLEALYDGEVTYHDRQMGKFIKELEKSGKLDDTIFVITSDHGEEFFEHDSVGHGHTLYQELLHVPLVIRAPGIFPKGKRTGAMAALSDIVPTVLDATGNKVPRELEGKSLIAAANEVLPDPQDAAFSSFYSEADGRNLQWAVRRGDWKMRMRGPVNTYVHYLSDDPGEKVDVDEQYPIARRALRVSLGQFIGCPDKAAWASGQIKSDVVGKPEAKEDAADSIPEDLQQQLRELGYMK